MCTRRTLLLAVLALAYANNHIRASESGQCGAAPAKETFSYSNVMASSRTEGIAFADLPGFTRSVYERDHALVTPESRVWAANGGWANTLTAHIVSRANGANFAMYLADMQPDGENLHKMMGVERLIVVLQGAVQVWESVGEGILLEENHYAYFPPDINGRISTEDGAVLLVYERIYTLDGTPRFQHGHVDDRPLLDTPGEVFGLRKLLPATPAYDFNVHVMDFAPGEYLNVKEVHYNQHGLLLLSGQGIYRLGNHWYPVQAGDAIWMAPYVPQWYAALGPGPTRYILYKDTTLDPLQ